MTPVGAMARPRRASWGPSFLQSTDQSETIGMDTISAAKHRQALGHDQRHEDDDHRIGRRCQHLHYSSRAVWLLSAGPRASRAAQHGSTASATQVRGTWNSRGQLTPDQFPAPAVAIKLRGRRLYEASERPSRSGCASPTNRHWDWGARVSMLRPRLMWSSISAAQPIIRPYRKTVKAAVSSARFGENAVPVGPPQHLQQQRGDHRIDVDAEHVPRHALVVQGLHERSIVLVEHVVFAALPEEAPKRSLRAGRD